jgi:hypothetical protein
MLLDGEYLHELVKRCLASATEKNGGSKETSQKTWTNTYGEYRYGSAIVYEKTFQFIVCQKDGVFQGLSLKWGNDFYAIVNRFKLVHFIRGDYDLLNILGGALDENYDELKNCQENKELSKSMALARRFEEIKEKYGHF